MIDVGILNGESGCIFQVTILLMHGSRDGRSRETFSRIAWDEGEVMRVWMFDGIGSGGVEIEQVGIPLMLLSARTVDSDTLAGSIAEGKCTTEEGEWSEMDRDGFRVSKLGAGAEF